MEVCLAIKEEPSGKYNTQDFGYTTDYDFIYPMGYSEVRKEKGREKRQEGKERKERKKRKGLETKLDFKLFFFFLFSRWK